MNKIDIVKQNVIEILGEDELSKMLETNEPLRHYIGYEISGQLHLGNGILAMLVVRDLQKVGVKCSVFLADWHTWINDKLGGDHDFIQEAAEKYFKPAMEVSAKIAGANSSDINFIHGTKLYSESKNYWEQVIEVSKNLTLSRVMKSTTIMGRKEEMSQPFAWLIYPPMQVADIFEMGLNIAHAGMDQRKIHVIAREVATSLNINPLRNSKGEKIKPIAIHHRLILGLQPPKTWPIRENLKKDTIRSEMKMSKSIPGSAIFVNDSEIEIRNKIDKAFCPMGEIELNPIFDWIKSLILPIVGEFTINREERHGGDVHVKNIDELEEMYLSNNIHPLDLKRSVADILVEILKPGRERFKDKESRKIIEKIKNIREKR